MAFRGRFSSCGNCFSVFREVTQDFQLTRIPHFYLFSVFRGKLCIRHSLGQSEV